ncbi:MAG: LptF/LptG family permease [Prevotellaceae bacterium]|jgi:lipopolysaccharide export system permease protein|nr:LptF/LptG family permease [Prevotellaceae bacterium]
MKLKIIDWYIIRKFIGTYFFALILIIVIVIIFDISEKIDDFVTKKAPLTEIIFNYYFTFIPFFVNTFSPLFVFISVIYFTSKMAYNTEIIAILSSGISFRRMMYPYFISAFLIFLLSFSLNHFIIPPANRIRLVFQEKYIKNPFFLSDKNLHFQTSPGIYVYMSDFEVYSNLARNFSIERHENGELKSKLISSYARWDTVSNKWKVSDYVIRDFYENGEILTKGAAIDTTINLTGDELKRRDNFVTSMNYFELNDYIEEQRMRGSKLDAALIEKYNRTAIPFSAFVLTIIGVSLSSRKVRGGIGLHIGIGIFLSFSYILLLRFSEMFVRANIAPPLLSVWIPNILFSIIAIILYRMAPK